MMITSEQAPRPARPARVPPGGGWAAQGWAEVDTPRAQPGRAAGAGAVRVRRARRDGRDQHGPGPADAPPGEPAPAGPVARRRGLHALLAVLRDQGLGDFP